MIINYAKFSTISLFCKNESVLNIVNVLIEKLEDIKGVPRGQQNKYKRLTFIGHVALNF